MTKSATAARRTQKTKEDGIDTYLAIASKRDLRSYRDDAIPDAVTDRILRAGQVSGSGMNRQQRRFVVITDGREQAAELVTRPSNVAGAALVIAIVVREGRYSDFDAGRAAQNMMLAAWNEGIASCPNSVAVAEGMAGLLKLQDEEKAAILIGFGSPAHGFDPGEKPAEHWLDAADRLPAEESVEYR